MSNTVRDSPENRSTVVLLLLAAFALALLDLWGYGVVSWWERRTQIRETRQQIEQETNVRVATKHVTEQLENWRAKSVSSDPVRAVSVLQRALMQIADSQGIDDVTVEPVLPKNFSSVGDRVTCSVQADMSTSQLASFIDQVHRLDALQRITKLDISAPLRGGRKRVGSRLQGSDRKRVAIHVEMIAIENASEMSELRITPADATSKNSLAAALKEHSILTRYVPPAPKPEVAPQPTTKPAPKPTETKVVAVVQPPPQVNYLERLKYVGSFSSHGVWQAWLFDMESKDQYFVAENDIMRCGDFVLRVTTVAADFLEFEAVDAEASGSTKRVELGDKLL